MALTSGHSPGKQPSYLSISAAETRAWAARPGQRWPSSTLAGRTIEAVLDEAGLLELRIDGLDPAALQERGIWIDGQELSALLSDLRERSPASKRD